jgi:hypothetical protein
MLTLIGEFFGTLIAVAIILSFIGRVGDALAVGITIFLIVKLLGL